MFLRVMTSIFYQAPGDDVSSFHYMIANTALQSISIVFATSKKMASNYIVDTYADGQLIGNGIYRRSHTPEEVDVVHQVIEGSDYLCPLYFGGLVRVLNSHQCQHCQSPDRTERRPQTTTQRLGLRNCRCQLAGSKWSFKVSLFKNHRPAYLRTPLVWFRGLYTRTTQR